MDWRAWECRAGGKSLERVPGQSERVSRQSRGLGIWTSPLRVLGARRPLGNRALEGAVRGRGASRRSGKPQMLAIGIGRFAGELLVGSEHGA